MAERDEEEQKGRSFKVQDRRRFTDVESGEHDDAVQNQGPQEHHEDAASVSSREPGTRDKGSVRDESPPPEMTFSTFVMGLTTQALMHLGEIADPVEQQVGRDLPAAKQVIDLLGILSDKTKGNLDGAEEQLLKSMLYDLRMRYVEVTRSR